MRYKSWNCQLRKQKYAMGNITRLDLIDIEDGSPVSVCTTNIAGLKKDEVAIKDYSENEGMLDFLLDNNIIHQPHRIEHIGYTTIPICRLI